MMKLPLSYWHLMHHRGLQEHYWLLIFAHLVPVVVVAVVVVEAKHLGFGSRTGGP